MSDAGSGRTRVGVGIGGTFTDLVARGGGLPARANSSLVSRGAEITAAQLRGQAVRMWTRPPAKLGGPSGVLRSARILTASATAIHGKGDVTGFSRFPDYSVIPGNPSTEQPDQKS